MTKLLERAFSEVSKLPEQNQDAIAEAVLAEVVFAQRWRKLFSSSQNFLAGLAEETLVEHHAGKTQQLECVE